MSNTSTISPLGLPPIVDYPHPEREGGFMPVAGQDLSRRPAHEATPIVPAFITAGEQSDPSIPQGDAQAALNFAKYSQLAGGDGANLEDEVLKLKSLKRTDAYTSDGNPFRTVVDGRLAAKGVPGFPKAEVPMGRLAAESQEVRTSLRDRATRVADKARGVWGKAMQRIGVNRPVVYDTPPLHMAGSLKPLEPMPFTGSGQPDIENIPAQADIPPRFQKLRDARTARPAHPQPEAPEPPATSAEDQAARALAFRLALLGPGFKGDMHKASDDMEKTLARAKEAGVPLQEERPEAIPHWKAGGGKLVTADDLAARGISLGALNGLDRVTEIAQPLDPKKKPNPQTPDTP